MSAAPPSRRSRLQRVLPLALVAVAAFGAGAVLGAADGPRPVAERYVAAWARGDYGGMHALLAPASQRRWPLRRFVAEHRRAAAVATLRQVRRAAGAEEDDDRATVAVELRTETFGRLRALLRLPLVEVEGEHRVRWVSYLVFPGLRRGEELRRETIMPARGAIEARDGTVLADGPDRVGELEPLYAEVVGRVGPIPPEQADEYVARGYPRDAIVGLTGLERQFEERLRGTFGGRLKAGARVLARAEPRPGGAVRSAISPRIQRAAVDALAGRLGGIAVLRPESGEVLALAGLATAAPQPPGSTFKIVTLAGALEDGVVKTSAKYPVQTSTTIEGVELENANGESCGGSLANSFAHSCNSVFAPLGVELGAERLVAAAERFGFNKPPRYAGASMPVIPAPGEIGDDLAVGSSAIGQGRLLSTPLHMAAVTGAIANGGEYVVPVVRRGARGERWRAVSARTARTVGRFMRRVVRDGTGEAAAIEGVGVAGKTGTAELRDSTPEPGELAPGEEPPPPDDITDTTAWFVAYAPLSKPRVAVAVMLVGQGAGGVTAAPAARQVLLSALRR